MHEHTFEVVKKVAADTWRMRCTDCKGVYDLTLTVCGMKGHRWTSMDAANGAHVCERCGIIRDDQADGVPATLHTR
jgi:hypothetical protein